jgi:hypothetical protein
MIKNCYAIGSAQAAAVKLITAYDVAAPYPLAAHATTSYNHDSSRTHVFPHWREEMKSWEGSYAARLSS